MRRLLPALVTVILLTAACDADPGPGSGAAASGGGTTARPSVSAPPQVARPWRAGMPEYGINVYWENTEDDSDEVVRAKAARILDYIVGLNANSVALNFPFYTTGLKSTTLRSGAKTPSPERVGIAVDEAVRRGLRTSIRPILNEKALTAEKPNAWRGVIAPTSRDAWFGSYRKLLLRYAAAADEATTFVVATELNSLEGDKRWPKLIEALRAKFPGEVAYSANFDSYQSGDVEVPADVVGVDAYPKLGLSNDATVDDIAAGWRDWLKDNDDDGPPVLHEAGIAAQKGAFSNPGHWGDGSRKLDLKAQQYWYDGICQTLRDGTAGGVYWWKVDFDADPADADQKSSDRMTFVGRPAENSIRKCFG